MGCWLEYGQHPFILYEVNKMRNRDDRLKAKIVKLQETINDLRKENFALRKEMEYYNKRVEALDKKEAEYNNMLAYLDRQKIEYERAIQQTRNVKRIIEDQIKKLKK